MRSDDYTPIEVPFSRDFRRMSFEDIRAYERWFMAVIPSRIEELQRACRSELPDWNADNTPASLDHLGEWFVRHIEKRPLSEAETAAARENVPDWIDLPTRILTERAASLAFDVGLYLGEVLLGEPTEIEG